MKRFEKEKPDFSKYNIILNTSRLKKFMTKLVIEVFLSFRFRSQRTEDNKKNILKKYPFEEFVLRRRRFDPSPMFFVWHFYSNLDAASSRNWPSLHLECSITNLRSVTEIYMHFYLIEKNLDFKKKKKEKKRKKGNARKNL